jgi:hypothetical protein
MVETAVSVLPRMGRSRGKSAVESKRYENDPSVIPPSLQQQQQWTPARISGSNNETTVSAVSTLPSAVPLAGKSVQYGKSYEWDSSHLQQQQQQQQSRRQRKNQRQQQQKYRQEKSVNQFGYGSNGTFRGKSNSSRLENGDYDDNQYHVDDDYYNNNTARMEGLMEEFLDSQEMYQDNEMYDKARFEKETIDKSNNSKWANDSNNKTDDGNDKIFVRYCDDILLVLSQEILEAIRAITLEWEQQRRDERKSYTDVYAYQYSRAIKATRAATRNTKVGHIDGYYKIFEETDSEQSTEDSKSSESAQEQPGATTRKQEKPPPLPLRGQQQKQTTAGQAAACSSNRQQQVQARKRNDKPKGKDKRAKKVWEKNGIDWVSWKDKNWWQSSMYGRVQGISHRMQVWDTERTERAGGGKAATVTRFRFW